MFYACLHLKIYSKYILEKNIPIVNLVYAFVFIYALVKHFVETTALVFYTNFDKLYYLKHVTN